MRVKQQIGLKKVPKFVKKTFKEHASLLVIVLGGLCFLFTNIILKEIFNPTDYGFYSMLVTYISIIHIYGLLGFENVLMRFSHQMSRNVVNVSTTQLTYIVVISTITTLVSFFWFKNYFQNQITFNYLLLFLVSFCSTISLFLFSVFRLNCDFVYSQFISNAWRIFLLFLTTIFLLFKWNNLTHFINVFLFVFVLIIVFLSIGLFRKISFDYTDRMSSKKTFVSFFYFFLSLTSISILLFSDRFIIENKLGIEAFGDYFYLTSLVLSPFTILQNYVGFKQLMQFKKRFSAKIFIAFNRKIVFFSVGLGLLVALFVFALAYFDFLNFDFSTYKVSIVLLLILGIARLYSATIISAYESQANIKTLKTSNWMIIASIVLIGFVIIYFCSSLNHIIIGFIVAWTIRNIILRQLLLQQITKQTMENL